MLNISVGAYRYIIGHQKISKDQKKQSMRGLPRKWARKSKDEETLLSPALEWGFTRSGDGTEHPDSLSSDISNATVKRTFCFIDLVDFTGYTRVKGPIAAMDLLEKFRELTRRVATARGVRIAKWLGDGVLLASVESGPVIATAAHLSTHFEKAGIQMRIGIATGPALFLEDDYVGEAVNLAAKLCNQAETGHILANVDKEELPDWVRLVKEISVDIRGIGRVGEIFQLEPNLG